MTNAKLIENLGEQIIPINKQEVFESDGNGLIEIGRTLREPVFVYDQETGKKITNWTRSENSITLEEPYKTVVVDYWYDYDNGCITLTIG